MGKFKWLQANKKKHNSEIFRSYIASTQLRFAHQSFSKDLCDSLASVDCHQTCSKFIGPMVSSPAESSRPSTSIDGTAKEPVHQWIWPEYVVDLSSSNLIAIACKQKGHKRITNIYKPFLLCTLQLPNQSAQSNSLGCPPLLQEYSATLLTPTAAQPARGLPMTSPRLRDFTTCIGVEAISSISI